MEIDSVDIARGHRWKLEALARCVGACEIETHLVAHDESYDGKGNVFLRANADSYHNGGHRFQQMDGMSGEIEHGDPDDFGAAVSKAMVDVGDGVDNLRRLHWSMCDTLGLTMQRGEIGAVFLKHRGQVSIDYVFGAAQLAHVSTVHPESTIADGFDLADGVRDEEN